MRNPQGFQPPTQSCLEVLEELKVQGCTIPRGNLKACFGWSQTFHAGFSQGLNSLLLVLAAECPNQSGRQVSGKHSRVLKIMTLFSDTEDCALLMLLKVTGDFTLQGKHSIKGVLELSRVRSKGHFTSILDEQVLNHKIQLEHHVDLVVDLESRVHVLFPNAQHRRRQVLDLGSFASKFWATASPHKHSKGIQVSESHRRLLTLVDVKNVGPYLPDVCLRAPRKHVKSEEI